MEIGEFISDIGQQLSVHMSGDDVQLVVNKLYVALEGCTIEKQSYQLSTDVLHDNEWYINRFIAIKHIAGCSKSTLLYYRQTLEKVFRCLNKHVVDITSDDLRFYLAIREERDGLSKTSLDNELRVCRSFWTAMAAEELLEKNITVKVPRIKAPKTVRKPFTEMELEKLRQGLLNSRDVHGTKLKHIAIFEVLASTGCRVGELIKMKRSNLEGNKMIVIGKGNKERYVYFNARALIALNNYLATRTDNYNSLFLGYDVQHPDVVYEYMTRGAVESFLRSLGKRCGVENCHPHRFRRTAATLALRRGMPIEQVSKLLGHEQLGTTQIYASSTDSDIERAHEKYLT